jgi:DNA polymerase
MPKISKIVVQLSPYAHHVVNWQDCDKCELCETRTKVVLARGTVPAPLLFIGEAPGASEDLIGQPFVGPAGSLLDSIIERADIRCKYAMTNLVACIPKENSGKKTHVPPDASIKACSPRLREFYMLCEPSGIVLVGTLAHKWVPKLLAGCLSKPELPMLEIIHPAAILRAKVFQQDPAVRRCIAQLADFVDSI